MNFFKRMMGCLMWVATAIVAVFAGFVILMWIEWGGFAAPVYETDDTANYGQITGNHNNDSPEYLFRSFFPEELEEHFRDVQYHYKAIRSDASACEIWLEFTLDEDAFPAFLEEHTDPAARVPFRDEWMEYPVASELALLITEDGPNLEYAEMGKVLWRESDRRVIFWMLYVFDGGGTEVRELSRFFTYFEIDPLSLATDIY